MLYVTRNMSRYASRHAQHPLLSFVIAVHRDTVYKLRADHINAGGSISTLPLAESRVNAQTRHASNDSYEYGRTARDGGLKCWQTRRAMLFASRRSSYAECCRHRSPWLRHGCLRLLRSRHIVRWYCAAVNGASTIRYQRVVTTV